MERLNNVVVIAIVLISLGAGRLQAAGADSGEIHMIGPVGVVRTGEVFTVELQLDSHGQQINAVEIGLRYPEDRLEIKYLGRENSILSLWPASPDWSTVPGLLTFSGGHPGGVFASKASLVTVYFRALQGGPVTLTLDPDRTAAYRHDGRGTRLPIDAASLSLDLASDFVPGITLVSTTHPTPEYWSHERTVHVGWEVDPDAEYSYDFGTDPLKIPDDVPDQNVGSVEFTNLADNVYYFTVRERGRGGPWSSVTQRRFLIDATPPEPFMLQLLPSATVGGAQVLSWVTTDATSGVATAILLINGQTRADAMSPVLTDPKWRGQVATVTVTDAAGNISTASLRLPGKNYGHGLGWWILGMVVVGVGLGAGWSWWQSRSPRR